MSENPFEEFVFSLDPVQFQQLTQAADKRIDKERYGFSSFEEAALAFGRIPVCPKCGSEYNHEDGTTPAGHKRYRCEECGSSYILLSDSIFNSAKISFHKLMGYIGMMSFNVPLEMCCEVLDIGSNTAELWRKKIFETVNGYQGHLKLYERVWLDETYIDDYSIIHNPFDKRKRGLSRDKICIVVAIDIYKNMVAVICGHGKPSSRRIRKALESHIVPGATVVHDGETSHNELIRKLNCTSEVYKADSKDPEYIEHMALINNMCGWLKRYIWHFIGMNIANLQSYLNWFIYLQRCKRDDEKWPKSVRILRHLLLSHVRYTRN